MSTSKFKSSLEAKAAGWFSRRNQTGEAHFNEVMKRREKEAMKKADSEARLEYWQSLSLQEQLEILDRKFGKNLGATKQRKKIIARIGSQK